MRRACRVRRRPISVSPVRPPTGSASDFVACLTDSPSRGEWYSVVTAWVNWGTWRFHLHKVFDESATIYRDLTNVLTYIYTISYNTLFQRISYQMEKQMAILLFRLCRPDEAPSAITPPCLTGRQGGVIKGSIRARLPKGSRRGLQEPVPAGRFHPCKLEACLRVLESGAGVQCVHRPPPTESSVSKA